MQRLAPPEDDREVPPGATTSRRQPRLIYLRGYGYIELPYYVWHYVGLIAAILLLPPLGLLLFLQTFDADAYRPRIAATLRQAIGQEVEISGPVKRAGIMTPRFGFGPVAVLGDAGGSRREIARIAHVEVELALWPLLHGVVDIRAIGLDTPDVLLERDAAGRGNWQGSTLAAATSTPLASRAAILGLQAITVRDGRLTWRDDEHGTTTSLNLKRVTITTASDGNLTVNTEATLGRDRVALSGEVGTLARLLDLDATTPWPVSLMLQARGGNFSAKGNFTAPLRAGGYTLQVNGDMRESQNFRNILPSGWPPLRNIALSVRLSDVGHALPDLTALSLTVGASDLSALFPGGRLERLELRAGGMNEALHGEITGVIGGAPLQLAAVLGTPTGVLQAAVRLGWLPDWMGAAPAGASVGFPIDVAANLGDSEFTANGAITTPASLGGLTLSINAALRDLQKLEPVLRRRLPLWDSATLQANLSDFGGSLLDGVALRDFSLTTPDGDLGGDATVRFGAKPTITARLHNEKLDLDGLANSFAALHFGTPPPLPAKTPPGMRAAPLVFHERPLALGGFDLAALDLTLALTEARLLGLPYKDLTGHIGLQNGALTIDKLAGMSPGGPVTMRFSYDTSSAAAPMQLRIQAPVVAIKPMLIALQRPEDISGNLAIDVDLSAEGRDPHALAGSLRGRAGLALVDGEIDTTMFAQYMFAMLRQAKMPMHLISAGLSRTRCFAAALVANHGDIQLDTLVLDSERLLIEANGRAQGSAELMDLRIRPQLRFGGPSLTVPLRLVGSFNGPHLLIDGTADGIDVPKAFLASAQAAERGADACPAALTAARNGAAGPMPHDKPMAVTPMPPPKREDNG